MSAFEFEIENDPNNLVDKKYKQNIGPLQGADEAIKPYVRVAGDETRMITDFFSDQVILALTRTYFERENRVNALALADAYLKSGDIFAALTYYDFALDKEDGAPFPVERVMDVAEAALQNTDKRVQKLAIRLCEALLERKESFPMFVILSKLYLAIYNNKIYFDIHSSDEKAELQRVMERISTLNLHILSYDSTNVDAMTNVADMAWERGDHEQAKTFYETALRSQSEWAPALLGMALYYFYIQPNEKLCLEFLTKIEKVNPNYPQFKIFRDQVRGKIFELCSRKVDSVAKQYPDLLAPYRKPVNFTFPAMQKVDTELHPRTDVTKILN